MKKYFITGVVILLPLAITLVLVTFILNFFTQPFVGILSNFLENNDWYVQHKAIFKFCLQIVLLFAIFFFTVLLGFLAKLMIFNSLINLYDKVLKKIPIIKTVYKATQQVLKTIFGSTSESFKHVVMVEYPSSNSYCIGLVSGCAPTPCTSHTCHADKDLLTVFIPTTPNPTSGFLIMYPKERVTFLNMKIEEAFKYIISCGVLCDSVSLSKSEQEFE